jgi:ubiquinone/menaquinone biosynthesis C-methylase UbiE
MLDLEPSKPPRHAVTRDDAAWAGQAAYTPATLRGYDAIVIGLSASYVWRCPAKYMLALYDQNVSARHLDVGVGTGYFLDACALPPGAAVTLLDSNRTPLEAAAARIRRYSPRTVQGNILAPLDLPDEHFDSVGLNFVLHCLPGSFVSKQVVFEHLARVLRPGGVLFGATVLGRGVRPNPIARILLAAYNRAGAFSNSRDDPEGLRAALAAHFARVELEVRGVTALFRAFRR